MVQNGPNDHFGRNALNPNWILAFAGPKWTIVLVFMGCRTIIARYVAKWGIAQMCLCETKSQGGGIAPLWGGANLP